MRIGVNTRFLLKGKMEGIGGYTFEVIKKMVAAHPEDEFIFFFDRAYDSSFITGENITPVVLFPPARHAILWYLWFEWAIPSALKKYKCDVFFSPDNYLSLRTNVPTVMVSHDVIFRHFPEGVSRINAWYYKFFTPKFFNKAKKIIAVSEYVKSDILNFYDVKENKITVAYNACRSIFKPLSVDNQDFIRKEYSDGVPYFLYVGAVHPRKNVHRLIAAFDHFKSETNSSFKLIIVGRFAWQTGDVKSAYDNSVHQKDIIFLSYIDNDILVKIVASAYALTYVSLFEGFGVPLIEAMNCDVPVITSSVCSMPEVVGDAGLCVDPMNVLAIANGMKLMYENEDFRNNLIEKGRLRRTVFDWATSAEIIYKVLHEVNH